MNFFPSPGTTGVQLAALVAAGSPGNVRLRVSAGSGGQGGLLPLSSALAHASTACECLVLCLVARVGTGGVVRLWLGQF